MFLPATALAQRDLKSIPDPDPELECKSFILSPDMEVNLWASDFVWSPAYSRVNGDLPLDGLPTFKPHANLEPTTFLRFDVEVSTPGRINIVSCSGLPGLALWLDGKPTPLTEQTSLDLSTGRHRLTLAVNRTTHTQPLRIELADVAGSPAQVQIVGGK